MRRVGLVVACLAATTAVAAPAHAYEHDTFYGWSPDGSYYAYGWQGTDEQARPTVCLSDVAAGSKTWPKGLARPAGDGDACTPICADDVDYECHQAAELKVVKWVALPKSTPRGPHGETVTVKLGHNKATFRVLRQGKEIARQDIETEQSVDGYKLVDVYWRADGGAVAAMLDVPPPRPRKLSKEEQEMEDAMANGWPAPRYLAIMNVDPPGDRTAAKAANVRGLTLHRARKYAEAVPEYRAAIAADASYAFAHYNLACAASLVGDRATAVAELTWLRAHAGTDADAKKMLAKGKTDSDLEPVRSDPQVRKLLGLPPLDCVKTCDAEEERCEDQCNEERGEESSRGCSRLCSLPHEECLDRCPKR